jgi:uracil-DNA glycosylase family 4
VPLQSSPPIRSLQQLAQAIHDCERCDRLRVYCQTIAQTKRRAYQGETYWGRPVSGFGAPGARLLLVGLAPAAHGANRTGRMFTGDRSGEWLYRALHKAGFANQPHALHRNDGLQLRDAYVLSAVRCAPPDNKPTPQEIENCAPYLETELKLLGEARVYLALGQIGLTSLWRALQSIGHVELGANGPKFTHAGELLLPAQNARPATSPKRSSTLVLMSYHPSQQNTFTGRLTEPMFDRVFSRAREFISSRKT